MFCMGIDEAPVLGKRKIIILGINTHNFHGSYMIPPLVGLAKSF